MSTDVPDDGVLIKDYGIGMITGPDFGCVNWASKEDEPNKLD
jgi:hypothetical protein